MPENERESALAKTYSLMVREVTAVLAEHDPVALTQAGAPDNEYEMEAGQIVRRILREAGSAEDAKRIAGEVFAEYFGPEYGEGFAAAGREIWLKHEQALRALPPPAFGTPGNEI